jgi:hypothetical protein
MKFRGKGRMPGLVSRDRRLHCLGLDPAALGIPTRICGVEVERAITTLSARSSEFSVAGRWGTHIRD